MKPKRTIIIPAMISVICLSAASLPGVPLSVLEGSSEQPVNNKAGADETVLVTAQTAPSVSAQSGDTVYLICDIATFSFGSYGGSDCWGWRAPDGTEYAIMGVYNGVAVVNTATMQVVGTIPGPENGCGSVRWRDMKTYQHYCYAVSECGGVNQGLLVIDMQYLPDSLHRVGAFSFNGYVTSHNLSIDTATGYAYLEGTSTVNNSIHIVSLANPEIPSYVHSFGPSQGIHDIFARNDTVYVAEGYNPYFSIYDVSNKNSPQLLARVSIPAAGYVHNIWPSEDGHYVATTEETAYKTVKVWNIADLGNVQLVGQYLGTSDLAHNAQVRSDTIFLSHYEAGVTVVDISNPSSPVEVGAVDTYPGSNSPNFNGCWGAFPYTSNGLVYGSNMDGKLFILLEQEAALADSLTAENVVGAPGTQVRIDINAVNTLPIRQFIVPISWAGPYNMSFDSVSTVGLRTEYFEEQAYVGYDIGNKRIAYALTSSNYGTSPDLAPGSGPILSVYLHIPPGATGAENPVTFTSFGGHVPTFAHPCLGYLPDTISGIVTLEPACCVGLRGNVDDDVSESINIADLTFLVDYLFRLGSEPPCLEEGNVDGDILETITIADVTYLVDYLFRSGAAPPACP